MGIFQRPGQTIDALASELRAANDNRARLRELPTAPMWVPLLFTFDLQQCCVCRRPIILEEVSYGLSHLPREIGIGWSYLQQFRHVDCSGPADVRNGKLLP